LIDNPGESMIRDNNTVRQAARVIRDAAIHAGTRASAVQRRRSR
jgi:hypothetical protein